MLPISLSPFHCINLFTLPTCRIFYRPRICPSSQLCDPSQQQLGQHRREPSPRRGVPPSWDFCSLARVFLRRCVCRCVRLATRLHTRSHAHVPASSALSGFNWMMGTLPTLAAGVIQTQSRSHRLQQVPPLRIRANPLSPVRWRRGND